MNNINIETLKKYSKLFNLKYIWEHTGLNKDTMYGKLAHSRELKVNEAQLLNDFFLKQGIIIDKKTQENNFK